MDDEANGKAPDWAIDVPMMDPKWERDRVDYEVRMLRMSAIDWGIRTEDIASKGATDNPVAIRNRIIDHAKAYIEFVHNGDMDHSEV